MSLSSSSTSTSRPSRWRRIFWILASAFLLTLIVKLLLPEVTSLAVESVAVVRVEGPILDAQQTVSDLRTFGEDSQIKAIVLRIDSPGGGVVPSQEIYNAVKRIRNKYQKTVVASMGTVAASGGYYIAVATDRILANPGTLTGSIGVIMQFANLQELLKKIGVQSIVIKSGKHKDLASPFREMREEDRLLLQQVMDDVHRQFIEAVAEGRSLDISEVEPLADGRIFTGQQAKETLLVDDLGDLEDAISLAATLSGIEGEPNIVEPSRPFTIRDFLSSQFFGEMPSLQVRLSGVNLMYLMAF